MGVPKGFKHSEETKKKIAESNTGRVTSEETKKKISESNIGKKRPPVTDIHRQHLSEGIKGVMAGDAHPQWNGGRKVTPRGYVLVRNVDHPFHSYSNYVFEHRLVMEEHIGRYLDPAEIIHHIDGDNSNNSIDNLFLFPSSSEHAAYHNRIRGIMHRNKISNKEAMLLLHPSASVNMNKTGEQTNE